MCLGPALLLHLALRAGANMDDQTINVQFVNDVDRTGSLFFVPDDERKDSFLATLDANGGTDMQDSYVTHRFKFHVEGLKPVTVKAMSTGTITFDVGEGELRATGPATTYTQRPNPYKGPKWESFAEKLRGQCVETFAGGSSRDADYFCNKRHDKRTFVTSQFDHSDEQAVHRMRKKQVERREETRIQPTWYHNFTDVGFSVLDIPKGLHAKLRSFHASQRLKSKPENMPWDDPNLSGRESDTWLADLPEDLKRETSEMLKRAIASWSGIPVDDLERTAFFGIRLYHQGSVLNMHVDRKETHVLSAILEVGRADASDDAPWPLKIVDHAGEVHLIPSREGQLILYESATCPHGRDEPLQGREMANCFAHFAPKGWPDKYKVRAEL